jgi:hypothetical protein
MNLTWSLKKVPFVHTSRASTVTECHWVSLTVSLSVTDGECHWHCSTVTECHWQCHWVLLTVSVTDTQPLLSLSVTECHWQCHWVLLTVSVTDTALLSLSVTDSVTECYWQWVSLTVEVCTKIWPCQIRGAPSLLDVFKGYECVSANKIAFFKN